MRVFVGEGIFRQAGVGEIDVCCWGLAHRMFADPKALFALCGWFGLMDAKQILEQGILYKMY